MTKHRETRGNPNHGKNTLIVKVPEGSSLALVSRYHGQACSKCGHFELCRPLKGHIDDSKYCHVMSLGWAPYSPKPALDHLAELRAKAKVAANTPGRLAELLAIHREIAQLAGKV